MTKPTPTPTPVTMGDIVQDATTEAACEVLGSPGFDGIDDTDVEALFAFVINVMRRANEKLVEAKRIGRPVELVWDLSEDEPISADSKSHQDPRRSSPETSSHPSFGNWMPQMPDQPRVRTGKTASGAGGHEYVSVTSLIGRQRRG